MSDDTYDDGSRRQRATLSVFVEDGLVKLALNDRQEHRSAYVSAEGLHDAFQALETGLGAGTVDWRVWSKSTKKGKG